MKPRIFIGSSSSPKSLMILETVTTLLSPIGDCIKWTNAFTQNKSNLESLTRQTKMCDFAVLIATKDDLLLKKEVFNSVPRDNVIFEFGLFIGATGLQRCFFLAEEGIDLPSDLDGITLGSFSEDLSKYNSIQNRCAEISNEMMKINTASTLGFLPSTALAIGYYYNFIRKVCEEIHTSGKIVTGEKENIEEVGIKEFKFNVIIPELLDDNGVDSFKTMFHKKLDLGNGTTGSISVKRGYPFVFKLEPPEQEDVDKIVQMFDVPSTLSTIVEALKIYMPKEAVGQSTEIEHLEKRELNNFAKVLRYLVSTHTMTKRNVVIQDNYRI